jgi:PLD-like domain
MPKFLNREGIKESLSTLFENAKKELIIVVPYIKLSDATAKLLTQANKRNIEIVMIYKEGSLLKPERDKLQTFQNLNLLSHPDIHTKCYCNETQMIIASMNLYDYSERYNREMGILLGDNENDIFDEEPFADALDEIESIIKSAKLEKKSLKAQKEGFKLEMLESNEELLKLACKFLNKYFDNKSFEVEEEAGLICFDYFDNINAIIEVDDSEGIDDKTGVFTIGRAVINFNWAEQILKRIHEKSKVEIKSKSLFPNFRIYWNKHSSNLTIYRDYKNQPKWNDLSEEQQICKFRQGIDMVIDYIKKAERSLR